MDDSVLDKIENLFAKDIIKIFTQIGSEPTNKPEKEFSVAIDEELKRYGCY